MMAVAMLDRGCQRIAIIGDDEIRQSFFIYDFVQVTSRLLALFDGSRNIILGSGDMIAR